MSRIGKNPIPIPKGVQVSVADGVVQVNGPKGALKHPVPGRISVAVEGEKVVVKRTSDEPDVRALHGLVRALLANAISGVTAGFKRELEIVGVGFKAELKNPREIALSLGFSHPVIYKAPEGVAISYDSKANRLTIEGIDKQKVGQVAAEIRGVRPPDAYKGKGVKYAGEVLKLKAGKTGA
jgi:large subunit ribosomal protein L6